MTPANEEEMNVDQPVDAVPQVTATEDEHAAPTTVAGEGKIPPPPDLTEAQKKNLANRKKKAAKAASKLRENATDK